MDNMPIEEWNGLHPEIQECWKQCQVQNSVNPMTKQCLKLQIQTKRHAEGLAPFNLVDEGEKIYKLRPDEVEKKERRREQNRRAAAKCRTKKKSEENHLKNILSEEEEKNRKLKTILRDLETQWLSLMSGYSLEGINRSLHDNLCHQTFHQNTTIKTLGEEETIYQRNYHFSHPQNIAVTPANNQILYKHQVYTPSAFCDTISSVNISTQEHVSSQKSQHYNGIYCQPGNNNLDISQYDGLHTNISGHSNSFGSLDSVQSYSPGCHDNLQSYSPGSLDSVQSNSPGCHDNLQSYSPGSLDSVQSYNPGCHDSLQSYSPGCHDSLQSYSPGSLDSVQSYSPGSQGNLQYCDSTEFVGIDFGKNSTEMMNFQTASCRTGNLYSNSPVYVNNNNNNNSSISPDVNRNIYTIIEHAVATNTDSNNSNGSFNRNNNSGLLGNNFVSNNDFSQLCHSSISNNDGININSILTSPAADSCRDSSDSGSPWDNNFSDSIYMDQLLLVDSHNNPGIYNFRNTSDPIDIIVNNSSCKRDSSNNNNSCSSSSNNNNSSISNIDFEASPINGMLFDFSLYEANYCDGLSTGESRGASHQSFCLK